MHHKFCLVDVLENESGEVENSHPVKGVLINGSMNWTANVRIFFVFFSVFSVLWSPLWIRFGSEFLCEST